MASSPYSPPGKPTHPPSHPPTRTYPYPFNHPPTHPPISVDSFAHPPNHPPTSSHPNKQEMKKSGFSPNLVNHNTVLDAIAEAGYVPPTHPHTHTPTH